MIRAAGRRLIGLHYGTYDYSAFLGIAAADQSLEHPAADHAKAVMQAAAAGTGVAVSDGSTNVLPVGDQLRAGWELHHRLVTRALHRGFYQGWDLHPAQLPTRFAATFQFFRAGAAEATTAWRRTTRAGPAPSPTSPRPCAPWPTSSSAGSSAAPSPTTRSRSRGSGSGAWRAAATQGG